MINTNPQSYIPNSDNTPLPSFLPTGIVLDVILNDKHPKFNELGGPASIGMVYYQPAAMETRVGMWAMPLQAYNRFFPQKGEYIYIIKGLFGSSTSEKETQVSSYYIGPINVFGSVKSNDTSDNKGTPLRLNTGDLALENRDNQSLRMGTDEEGYSYGIWRLGSNKKDVITDESFDEDSAIIAVGRGKKFPIEMSYINTGTYDDLDIKFKSEPYVPVENPVNESSTSDIYDDTVAFPAREIELGGKDQESPEEVKVEFPENLPEQNYTYIGPSTMQDFKVKPISINQFDQYVGFVDPAVPIYYAALLDVISFTEGTIGIGQNGYDIIVGVGSNNNLKITNWNPFYTGGHPMANGYRKFQGQDGNIYTVISTASGRYQFIAKTWNNSGAFNKRNQDIKGYNLVKNRLSDYQQKYLNTLLKDKDGSVKIWDALAPEWASIPYSLKSGGSYYDGQRARVNAITCNDLYFRALRKYEQRQAASSK